MRRTLVQLASGMAICPNCNKEVFELRKSWKFGQFTVNAYFGDNCGIHFREYFKA